MSVVGGGSVSPGGPAGHEHHHHHHHHHHHQHHPLSVSSVVGGGGGGGGAASSAAEVATAVGLRRRRGRFHCADGQGEDLWAPRDSQDNLNTIRKTRFDLELVKSYLRGVNEKRAVHDIPPHELDPYLASFIGSVKKKNGEDFEPGTLRGILGSVDRYFRKHNYGHAIFSGNVRDFPSTRDALAAKQKQLKREGRGNHPNRAQPITNEEVEVLYLTGQLGTGSPDALLNTVWFNNWVYFGLRGMKVHRHLRWGDILLARLDSGAEYLEYVNGQSKPFRPRVYAMPEQPDRDPVAVYKLYMAKRPRPMLSADAPFYLAPNSRKPNYSDAWFKCQAAGENRLGRLMKTMVINAGLPEKKRIAYKSISGHPGKVSEVEQQSSSASSTSSHHNGLPHLAEKSPLPLSMFSLLTAETSLQIPNCGPSHLSSEQPFSTTSSSSTTGCLESLDVATRQLWQHYKSRGGFSNDRDFILHLLQREQGCRECNNRNLSGSSTGRPQGEMLWQQKNQQSLNTDFHSSLENELRETHYTNDSNNLKPTDNICWNDGRESAKDDTSSDSMVSEAVMLFKEWLQEKNLATDFEKFSKVELNDFLGQYYQDVSEEYGVDYKWSALDRIRCALDKHLSSCVSRPIDIINDSEFKSSNDVLQGFIKRRRYENSVEKNSVSSNHLKPSGEMETTSQIITTQDLLKIHTSPLLMTDNPEGLLHKVWFDTCLFLGITCGENPYVQNLKCKVDANGSEYYCFESVCSSHHSLRLYSSSGSYCPFAALKQYLTKRNPKQEQLFQHPCANWNPRAEYWYSAEPMSRDDLESIADFLLRSTELSQCYSLFTLQSTGEWVQSLLEMGKERDSIFQLTGVTTGSELQKALENPESKETADNPSSLIESITDLPEEISKKQSKIVGHQSLKTPSTTQSMLMLPTDHFSFVQSNMPFGSVLLPSVGSSSVPPMLLPVSFPDPSSMPAVMYLKQDQNKQHHNQEYRNDLNISINCISNADHVS